MNPLVTRHFRGSLQLEPHERPKVLVKDPETLRTQGPHDLVTWGRGYACVSSPTGLQWIPSRNVRPYVPKTSETKVSQVTVASWRRRKKEEEKAGFFLICGDRAFTGIPARLIGGPCTLVKLSLFTPNMTQILNWQRKNSSHHAPIQKRDLTSLDPDCDSEIIHWSRAKATALMVFLPWVSVAKSMGELGRLECWVAKQANLTTKAISDLLSDEQVTRQATLQNWAAIDYLLLLNQHLCKEFEGLCCFNLSSKAENIKKSIQQLRGIVDSIKQETGDWFDNIFKGVGLSNIASSWVKTGLLVLFIILIVAIASSLVKNLLMNVIFSTTTPSVHSMVPAIEFPPDSVSSSECNSEIYTPEH
ncbi:hypothetical protein HGM15179_021063 [Zosterops borbonicus]|uniref:Integrase-type domain-containing protein n=1 Tax=Zosterops borbonicus TaxID=364589 RepID=A0A8K1D818_9PASS|nr:hypothetical protein HGM15179_021063 [Zosterops borbonicus]